MQNFTQWLENRDADLLDEISTQDKILGLGLALGTGALAHQTGNAADDLSGRLSRRGPTGMEAKLSKKDAARKAAVAARLAQGDNPAVTEDPRDPRNQNPEIVKASTDMAKKLRNYGKSQGYFPKTSGPSALQSPDNPDAGWEMLSRSANRSGNY